jgi:uncharacterized surface protein with fasciclin (FAS1) repeats
MRRNKSLVALPAMLILFFTACKKQTDDHNETNQSLKDNLFQLISADANLSTFANYVKQTGYDSVLTSSKNYTVYALPNNVLTALDPSVVSNPAKLRLFIGNHIASQLYYTAAVSQGKRVPMVNGKYHNIKGNKIEDATITTADKLASNGVYHVIDKMLPALENAWEYIDNNPAAPAKQSNFMMSIFRNVFDTTNAVVIGIDPLTGAPIYQQGTDSIFTNVFWNRVHDLKNESKQFTLFVLTDAAWDAEVNKYKPAYVTGLADSTTAMASWTVLKDFAVDTLYEPASIPDSVVSKFGVKVPVVRSHIVQTIRTSNGIIYIMDQIDIPFNVKFKPYVVEAESYNGFSNDRRGNTYFRDRYNNITGKDFRDVLVLGHGVAQFNLRYDLFEVPSIKYKVYWVAVNDFQTGTFQQKVSIGTPTAAALPYLTVNLNDFNEIYLGEITMSKFEPKLPIYLTAANNTTQATNPIVCDYIKLVPSF